MAAFAPRIIHGDFLRLPLGQMFPGGVNIIGNFPYNISSQIFFKVLENRDLVSGVRRHGAERGGGAYSRKAGHARLRHIERFLQAYYDIEYLFTVNENVFSPPPKVKSAVIR